LKDALTIASGRDENKFEVTGLTPVKRGLVSPLHIEKFPLALSANSFTALRSGSTLCSWEKSRKKCEILKK